MSHAKFVLEYFESISGKPKTAELCDHWMTDQELKEHIIFFDTIFPNYELFADEITSDGDRVVVRARMTGIHKGTFEGIPPTNKQIEMPFAIGYTILDYKIIDHWLIADQIALMQQLGVVDPKT